MRRLFAVLAMLATLAAVLFVPPPIERASASTATMLSTPLPGAVLTQGYHDGSTTHVAYDYDVTGSGDKTDDVEAVGNGRVKEIYKDCERQSGDDDTDSNGNYTNTCGGGFGNYVIVQHKLNDSTGDYIYTTYAHLDEIEDGLEDEQCVNAGDPLGELGHTGASSAEHLHFEVNDSAVQYGYEATIPAGSHDPGDYLGDATLYEFCPTTPDTDNDGVANVEDGCPLQEGLPVNGGCPDGDDDGIIDNDDECDQVAGIIGNNGCPADDIVLIESYNIDYDSDGDDDILYLYRAGGNLRLAVIWGSTGTSFGGSTNIWQWAGFYTGNPDRELIPAGLGDHDDDGHIDVLFFHRDGHELELAVVWGQSGQGTRSSWDGNIWQFTDFYDDYPDHEVFPVGMTDFDHDVDGIDDVLFLYRTGDNTHLRLAAIWGEGGRSSNRTSQLNLWQYVDFLENEPQRQFKLGGLADVDDDGDLDITLLYRAGAHLRMAAIWGSVGQSTKSSTNNVWEFANIAPSTDLGRDYYPLGVTDFDKDGDDDVVVVYRAGGNLRMTAFWGSTGQSAKGSHTSHLWEWSNGWGSKPIYPIKPTDLDNDGDLDLGFFYTSGGGNDDIRLAAVWTDSGQSAPSKNATAIEWVDFQTSGDPNRFPLYAGSPDLDDDGDDDIVFFYRAGNHLRTAIVYGSTGQGGKSRTDNIWAHNNFGVHNQVNDPEKIPFTLN